MHSVTYGTQCVFMPTYFTCTIAEGRDLLFMEASRNYQFPPNYNYIILNNFGDRFFGGVFCISRSGNPYITAEGQAVSEYISESR